ncbi:hypothetical protein CMU99_16265 [Elizabethkingia anophelis]|nr:hypothetical protein [Elizabethkingia anophelis]
MEGKAKEAFKKWFDKKYLDNWNYYNIPENNAIINALTIEWLDSIDIIIEIGIHQRIGDLNMWRGKINNFIYDDLEFKVSRQEATEAAIKKAVEIYNSKYGNPQGDPETKQ